MKYSKLLIPVAALFVLSSCSPKVSNSMASTESSASSSVNSMPIEANSKQAGKTTTATTGTTSSQQANSTMEIALPSGK